jgi:UDP-N-acetyl-D-glucosamine dehydrogenase
MLKVSIVGQGYVGVPLAIRIAETNNIAIGYDIDESKITDILSGRYFNPDIDSDLIKKLIGNKNYIPTSDPELLGDSEVIIIAVPTPLYSNGKPDISYLESASKIIAKYCKDNTLIVNESTSYPGTLRNVIVPIFRKYSRRNLYFASAPERIDPGNKKWNLSNTPRIVGGLTDEATVLALNFYKILSSNVQSVSSPEVAESAKLLENTFRQVNIALVNEFTKIAKVLKFSANEAIQAAATKPFGFMPFFPSIGVGGHCIPVDPNYLSYAAKQEGVKTDFINLANSTNLGMIDYTVGLIGKYYNENWVDLKIQVAGIAYKPGVSDIRESPALALILALRSTGANVFWHDPLVSSWQGETSAELSKSIDLGLIVTPHKEINFSLWKNNKLRVLDLSANSEDYGWPKFL